MLNLAMTPIAPILGQRVPLRGPARLLYRSYAKAGCHPGDSKRILTSKLGDDFNIDLSSLLEWEIWAFGSYEEHFAELFRYLIGPGDRCVDIGANVGVHTVRLAKLVGQRGEVIAVEPDQELARRARNNVLLNHLNNVRVIEAAASQRAGDSVLLYRPDAHDSNKARASMLPHPYLTGSRVTVETVAIDGINHEPVALIKIDVEGSESAVVSGASHTIDAYFPSIIFEYAPELLSDKSCSPFMQLMDRGYNLFQIYSRRHSVTGRGNLEIERLWTLPDKGGNILAVSTKTASLLSTLVR
jgi:FkbM family methyltransferase